MLLNIPIYIATHKDSAGVTIYSARPLFHSQPRSEGAELHRVLGKLSDRLRRDTAERARSDRHDTLLDWHDSADYQGRIAKLHLDLGHRSCRLKLLLVEVQRYGQRFGFSPSLSKLWFDLQAHEPITQRATEVFQQHLREVLKESPDFDPQVHSLSQSAWIDAVSVAIPLGRAQAATDANALMAALSGNAATDGAEELQTVGRCLSWLDVDDLAQPIDLDTEVQLLLDRMKVDDRQPVALVGPAGSGKTAIIEGAVRQRKRLSKGAPSLRGQVWQISPARLISGMSYLGQWESRVLAILKHCSRKDHVLYIDDFLGLFQAGRTRDSSMAVADLLRAQLDRLPVRIVTEMTAEAWAVLREKDRVLADRFFVIRTEAMDTARSLRVLLGVQRQLESKHRCEFELDVLSETLGLYERFVRDAVLPGKAAAALTRLAARHTRGKPITREAAVDEFRARSGLSRSIIDLRKRLTREDIATAVSEHILGQHAAVEALADRILLTAARMNDVTRPIGTFLLLGPTGVGKTQTAKWLANYLFGEDGLIRLDMNELSSPGSVARLVGTFDNPDGLLTAAVRRKPHAVLLLDEIEKAHPAVLDVLLQVLGEARLTDARGRVADFSGTLILMTSNLGARESLSQAGFASQQQTRSAIHHRAARSFFRPEFFNRIDGLLDYGALDPGTIRDILHKQLQEVLTRDGLARRRLVVDVDPRTIDRVAAEGFNPRLGARAVRRRLERDLVNPTSRALAEMRFEQTALVRIVDGDAGLQTNVYPLEDAQPSAESDAEWTPQQVLGQATDYLAAATDAISHAPVQLEAGGSAISTEMLESLAIREAEVEAREAVEQLRQAMPDDRLDRPPALDTHAGGLGFRYEPPDRSTMRQLQAIDDIQDYFREAVQQVPQTELDAAAKRVRQLVARLQNLMDARGSVSRLRLVAASYGDSVQFLPVKNPGDTELRLLRAVFGDENWDLDRRTFSDFLQAVCETYLQQHEQLQPDAIRPQDSPYHGWEMLLESPLIEALVQPLVGSYLLIGSDGRMTLAVVSSETIPAEPPAVRFILHSEGPLIDLRGGTVIKERLSQHALLRLLSGAVPALPQQPPS
ncbi:AAA family ATPase [Roseimaritima ulvae]|uniref:ATP-dependent Clp protease ATP-binding subunit ClpL n=1 Tax=Roseimaritima ulvae TaxID=980254 RepID=A0A5B9QZR2_9BACT|nr:AAA family ATPase [Roseimaritima ulvae]QEG43410.1 ATP-dependent Clp protease ATP-binding subunit ClpL [Roseimaritima ulvae]